MLCLIFRNELMFKVFWLIFPQILYTGLVRPVEFSSIYTCEQVRPVLNFAHTNVCFKRENVGHLNSPSLNLARWQWELKGQNRRRLNISLCTEDIWFCKTNELQLLLYQVNVFFFVFTPTHKIQNCLSCIYTVFTIRF